MKDVDRVIDELLVRRPAGFRNKHLAEALGVSRSRACRILAPRVLSGELERIGDGPRKYVRGPDSGIAGGVARGAPAEDFWRSLADYCRELAYVSLSRLALTNLRTRQQVRTLVRGLRFLQRYIVIDFEGVHSISPAAAHELLHRVPWRMRMNVQPINMEAEVARTVWHVIKFGHSEIAIDRPVEESSTPVRRKA